MRPTGAALVLVLLLTPQSPLGADEVVIRPWSAGDVAARSATPRPIGDARTDEKVDPPANDFFVPYFAVDTTASSGTTTLFGVRNPAGDGRQLLVLYAAPDGTELDQEQVVLSPGATFTRNLRDLGLPADPDGFARGWVRISADGPIVGDYLQVDLGNDFATGDRLVAFDDFCTEQEIRFLDVGSGTVLHVMLNAPQGTNVQADPASVVVRPIDEAGNALPAAAIYTDAFSFSLEAEAITAAKFGTFVLDFTNSNGGVVFGEYSAGGRFSVGMNGACTVE